MSVLCSMLMNRYQINSNRAQFIRCPGTGVTTYSLHPGAIITELGRYIPFLGTTEIGNIIYYYATYFFVKDPLHGAQTQICCSVDEQMGKESGYYYR